MREFFRGWRRKIGVLTLVMACVIFALLCRSHFVADNFWDSINGGYSFDFDRGQLRTSRVWGLPTLPQVKYKWHWDTYEPSAIGRSFEPRSDVWNMTTSIRFPGFKFGLSEPNQRLRMFFCHVSLFWFMVPLTLLSTYLLLRKSGGRKTL